MYESGQEWREFVAATHEEIVAKATAFFGVGEDELKIVEIEGSALSGLGGRCAAIAVPKQAAGRSRPRRREREQPERRPGSERGNRRSSARSEPVENRQEGAPQRAEPVEPPKATVAGELGEVGLFIKGILERMRIGDFEISESQENDELIAIQIQGDAASRLGGGEARTSEAIQLLANQAAMRISEGEPKRVVLDVEGEGSAREQLLEKVAERAARRAQSTGRPVALEAMNSRDRRIIHVTLGEMDGVATMSVGEGRYRQVVVVPEGSPEYEKASQYETPRTDS